MSILSRLVFGPPLVMMVACGAADADPNGCAGNFTIVSQSAANTLTLGGSYENGQPIMKLSQNGQTIANVGANSVAEQGTDPTFDITGLAKGTYLITILMSCQDANEQPNIVWTPISITIH